MSEFILYTMTVLKWTITVVAYIVISMGMLLTIYVPLEHVTDDVDFSEKVVTVIALIHLVVSIFVFLTWVS